MLVDISIDQGGCFETSRPTTWKEPTYVEDGVTHFCVTNMPGAVPQTSSQAICAAILPWVQQARVGQLARQPSRWCAASTSKAARSCIRRLQGMKL